MSNTPRTDQMEQHAYWFDDDMTPVCESRLVRPLELELNAEKQHITELENRLRVLWDKLEGERKYYQERIKRLEEAGDAMESCLEGWAVGSGVIKGWNKAKEDKP